MILNYGGSVKALIRNRWIKKQNYLDFSGIDYDIWIIGEIMDRSLFVCGLISWNLA